MAMHQVSDPSALQRAIKAGMPFGRASCGSVVPRGQLTNDHARVSCSLCVEQAPAPPAAPAPSFDALPANGAGVAEAPSVDFVDDGFDDLDADLDSFDDGVGFGVEWQSPAEDVLEESDSTQGETSEPETETDQDPLAMVGSMLSGLVGDDFVPVETWARWMVEPGEDPEGALLLSKNRKVDLRQFVPEEDLEFLRNLGQLASMIGADGVSSKMASIVHRLAEEAQKAGAKPTWRPSKKKAKAPAAQPSEGESGEVSDEGEASTDGET
jgi:hypothetical protein